MACLWRLIRDFLGMRSDIMKSESTPKPPLKWHGGKYYLASRIVEMMPPHQQYVEPFFGGGTVLLAKDPHNVGEIVNDLNGHLTNFWNVLKDDALFAQFQRIIQAVPFSETEWRDAHARLDAQEDPVQRAVAFYIECRQSHSGRRTAFAAMTKTRLRQGMNEQAAAWMTAVDGLPAVHARLRRVAILNRDALKVIKQFDTPQTLFYLDPPYLHSTRSTTEEYGEQEMSVEQHEQLLDLLIGLKGKVLLSGYPSPLYEQRLTGWHKVDFDLPNNSAAGATKERKTERIWCNFKPAAIPAPRTHTKRDEDEAPAATEAADLF
jgi:DNA adenine methylase